MPDRHRPHRHTGPGPYAHRTEGERTRIVVITGAPGVGKTEVARRLVRRYEVAAALMDTDTLADIYPWCVDDRLYGVLGRNLRACLATYRDWGARIVVISGVMLPGRSLDQFHDLIDDPSLDWVFYGLRAGPAELASRIRADPKMQDPEGRLSWRHLDDEVPSVPDVREVDTNASTLDEVVDIILGYESADLPRGTVSADLSRRTAPPSIPGMARVPLDDAMSVCVRALNRLGFPEEVAVATATDLLEAESAGMSSHGMLRIPEYAASIEAGHLDPSSVPHVTRSGRQSWSVDGRRAPGVAVRECVVKALVTARMEGPVVVGLRASGHLGRLAPMARQVALHGLALVGFVNYCGAGQKVAPANGVLGVWATNPILLACPAPPGPPVIVDMSTSVVAEGVIRAALLRDRRLPAGLLVGPNGEPVTDPHLLYTDPPQAAILPAAGHKGHALAAFVEVLAGAVAGAGHLAEPRLPGNGGLFIAFPIDSLGQTGADIAAAVARIEERLRVSAGASEPATPPRLPGRGPRQPKPADLTIPAALWERLRTSADLADWTTVPLPDRKANPS